MPWRLHRYYTDQGVRLRFLILLARARARGAHPLAASSGILQSGRTLCGLPSDVSPSSSFECIMNHPGEGLGGDLKDFANVHFG